MDSGLGQNDNLRYNRIAPACVKRYSHQVMPSLNPTEADRAYVSQIQKPVRERGGMAHWIAPPTKGVNGQPLDFEYVRRA